MKSKLRKYYVVLLVFALLLCNSTQKAYAAVPVVDLQYWHSGSSSIFYWTVNSIPIYFGSNTTNSTFSISNLQSRTGVAFAKWSPATGLTRTTVNNQGIASLVVGAITQTEAISIGLPANVPGVTYYGGVLKYYGSYSGSLKNIYEISAPVSVFFVDSSLFSSLDWTKITVHEIGHAFGYDGHYDYGNIMTTYYESISSITPSSNEINHLAQVY